MSRLRAAWKGSGASQPAHKMAETIAGQGFSKRVFYGQRILVIHTGGDLPDSVAAATSEAQAVRMCDPISGRTSRWYWCETVDGKPFTPPPVTAEAHRAIARRINMPTELDAFHRSNNISGYDVTVPSVKRQEKP